MPPNPPTGKLLYLSKHQRRASEWHVTFFTANIKGIYRYSGLVFDYENGLTEREAWQAFQADFRYWPSDPKQINPPAFHECVCTPLASWPYHEAVIAQPERA